MRLTLAVFAGTLASVTLKVSAVPDAAVVGVPVIDPVDEFSVRPLDNVPEVSDQLYGVVPPEASNDAE